MYEKDKIKIKKIKMSENILLNQILFIIVISACNKKNVIYEKNYSN